MRMADEPRLLVIVPVLAAEYPTIRHGNPTATNRTTEA
jgi:hypothetical protein